VLILSWLLAVSVTAADVLFLQWLPISFSGLLFPVGFVSLLIAAGLLLRERVRRAAWIANCAALWIAMLVFSPILTYIAASFAAPLYDAEFARQDLALGFDWRLYATWIELHPTVETVLLIAYESLFFQGLLAVIYLPLRGRHGQFLEVYSATTIAIVLTAALSGIFPAWGPIPYFFPARRDIVPYLTDLEMLRAGKAGVFAIGRLQGLVQFPSFHGASAFLMSWGFRRCGLLTWAVIGLNGLLLASAPWIGNHYLVDLIGGAVVAAVGIVVVLLARRAIDPAAQYLSRPSGVLVPLPESRS